MCFRMTKCTTTSVQHIPQQKWASTSPHSSALFGMQGSDQLQTHGCSLKTSSAMPPNPHSLLFIPAAGPEGVLGHRSSPEYGVWKFPLLLAVALDLRGELRLQLLHQKWSFCLRSLSRHVAAPRRGVTHGEMRPHAFRVEG